MKRIFVVKYNGKKEPYNQQKVLSSILRVGIKPERAAKILSAVENRIYNQISTQELYRLVREEIRRQGFLRHSRLYCLREALAKMDPTDFEKFIQRILEKEQYDCQWNVLVKGFCIEHQIDVVAKSKKGEVIFVEVKHHRRFHRDCGLGVVAELWARLEDLQKNNQFDSAWLITNTKFSQHAQKYARCKHLRLTGWRYNLLGFASLANSEGLEKQIESLGVAAVDAIIKKLSS